MLLSGYYRNLRLENFYYHRVIVIQSMERLRENYFNQELDRADFRAFALSQYNKLYEVPSFIDKYAIMAKHGSSEIQIASDGSTLEKDKKQGI